MKNAVLFSLVIAAVFIIVVAPGRMKHELTKAPQTIQKHTGPVEKKRRFSSPPQPEKQPLIEQKRIAAPLPPAAVKKPVPRVVKPKPVNTAQQQADRRVRQFKQLQDRLAAETDPDKRLILIDQMSGYVRVDTLTAIDWAMTLQDPQEQQAAIEAINKRALVGIGAKIMVDETGYPRIQETTIMSAVGATGQVEAGDYIVGMDDGTGTPVYFDGIAAHKVAQQLRGEPGTELRLLMERLAPDGSNAEAFEVVVRRSLLVVEPSL